MIPIVLVGAAGRMGRAVEIALSDADDMSIKSRVELGATGQPEWGPALVRGDVVIEFSSPAGCVSAAHAAAASGAALVSGTTGLGAVENQALREAAQRVAVLHAANFSVGALVLKRVLAAALEALPEEWDIEIVERHHRHKVDSPSGTALALAREAARRRGAPESVIRSGREGAVGPRAREEIGVHSVRGGSWVGDHEVLIAGTGESLELRHIAYDRSAFAHGAVAAARFVAGRGPGLYTLEDVVSARSRRG